MKQKPNPNPHLKTIAIVAGIVGGLIGMYYNEKRRTAPVPRHEQPARTEEARPTAGSDARPERSDASRASVAHRADFDFYLLALSLHHAFCADGHGGKPECRAGSNLPLVIHGLWPEKLEPRAYPRDCPAPPLDLEPAFARELAPYMPGMQSGLHQHEWRTHGGCSGLGDDEYFRSTFDHARHLDAALRADLAVRAGGEATPADLRAVADRFESGLGATFTLHCRTLRDAPVRGVPYLVEVRQCLDDDGANGGPGTPLECARVNRRDQGCGGSFLIADFTP